MRPLAPQYMHETPPNCIWYNLIMLFVSFRNVSEKVPHHALRIIQKCFRKGRHIAVAHLSETPAHHKAVARTPVRILPSAV